MSKHLRNQRRILQTNTQMTEEHSPVAMENTTVTHEAFTAASELVHDEELSKVEANNFSLTANEQEENMQNNAPSVPYVSEEHPNGDDPDRVPVIPELADDQVPNMPGAILKHAREMLGLSLRDVSNRLNLRVNTVSDIEHDRLNQPTASNFVIPHITSYAKLVNIDPHTLVELYMNNVREVMQEAGKRAAVIHKEQRRAAHHGLKIALLSAGALALVVLGIGIGVYIASSSNDEEDASGALTLSPGAQVQQELTGAGEDPFPPEQSTQESAQEVVDPNTQMAREQAEALGTNDIINNAQKGVSDENKDPLQAPLEQGSLTTLPANIQVTDAKSEIKDANTQANNKALKESQNAALTLPKDSIQEVSNARAPLPVATPVVASSPVQNTDAKQSLSNNSAQKKAPSPASGNTNGAKNNNVKTSSAKDVALSLPSAVRDISSSVRIVNRNDIGSLNTVTVQVKAPVAIRILGARKVLKSGTFKAGENISVTGMPPLRIEVSDTSKITVKYNGGTAVVPAERNVGYDLPVR